MINWKKRVSELLLSVMLFCILFGMPPVMAQPEIDDVNENIDSLKEQKENSGEKLNRLEQQDAALTEELYELNAELSALAEELTETEEILKQGKISVKKTKALLEASRKKERDQYESMKKRIRFLYEKGKFSLLELMLESDGFADFLNQSRYIVSIHAYDRKMLEEYKKTREETTWQEQKLKQEQKQLLEKKEKQEKQKEQVESLVTGVDTKRRSTKNQIVQTREEMAAYAAAIEEQKAYEEELEQQKASGDAKRLDEIRLQEAKNTAPVITSSSQSDIALMAALIECEAGGESYEGKLAVGSVVMNRMRSLYFPNTVISVIYQDGQFTPVASGRFASVLARGAEEDCVKAAAETLAGNITLDCLYFRRNNGHISGIVIGNHVFY